MEERTGTIEQGQCSYPECGTLIYGRLIPRPCDNCPTLPDPNFVTLIATFLEPMLCTPFGADIADAFTDLLWMTEGGRSLVASVLYALDTSLTEPSPGEKLN